MSKTETKPEAQATKRERARIAIEERIRSQRIRLRHANADLEEAKKEKAEKSETVKHLQKDLNELLDEWDDVCEGRDYQPRLIPPAEETGPANGKPAEATKPATSPAPAAPVAATVVDEWGLKPVKEIGLTEHVAELFAGVDVRTVIDFEKFIASGKFVPGSIKGMADKAINKVADQLTDYRKKHPKPKDVDNRQRRCGKCNHVRAGDIEKCPICGETIYERVEPESASSDTKEPAKGTTKAPPCPPVANPTSGKPADTLAMVDQSKVETIPVEIRKSRKASAAVRLYKTTSGWVGAITAVEAKGAKIDQLINPAQDHCETRILCLTAKCGELAAWFRSRIPTGGEAMAQDVEAWIAAQPVTEK